MPEIHLGLIEKAYMHESNPDGPLERRIELWLPDRNSKTIDHEIKPNPYFWLNKIDELKSSGSTRIAYEHTPLVTPSAGTITVFAEGERITGVAMAQKDMHAPRDPGFFVPQNGFPQSSRDWETLMHLYRETFEELLVLTDDHCVCMPKHHPEYDELVRWTAEGLVTWTGLSTSIATAADMEFLDGPDELVIRRPGKKGARPEVHKGFLSWTPETGFNFIKLLRIQGDISQYWLADGEKLPDGSYLQRPYALWDVKDLQGKAFGDSVDTIFHRRHRCSFDLARSNVPFYTDKVPRSVLCNVEVDGKPIYPIDWMEESYDLLSNPSIQAKANRIPYSTYEKELIEKSQGK